MEKIESKDKLFSDFKPPSKNKLKEFFATFLKFTIGIVLLPVIYAVSVCFTQELIKLEPVVIYSFVWGIMGFLGVYLFVGEPVILYKKGQKIVEGIVRFFAPLVKVASFVLPIYMIIIFTAYLIARNFTDVQEYASLTLFIVGFSLALHLVFSAKTLRSKQGDPLKSGYLFGFSWIYILDALILAFFFNSAFEKFSFISFVNGSYQISQGVYLSVFKQLFSVSS